MSISIVRRFFFYFKKIIISNYFGLLILDSILRIIFIFFIYESFKERLVELLLCI